MSDLAFAEPQWAYALWGVLAVVALLIALDRRGSALLARFLSGRMQRRLVARPSARRRLLGVLLLGLAGAFVVLALMRPQWGLRYEPTPRVGTELMVCLDVSNSMLAEDVAPNRLERAKAEIEDLLRYLDGDHVGLIVFAGRATVLSPLTPDFGFLRLVLSDAGPTSVERGGTNLAAPIEQAVAGFGDTGDVSRAVLLITDGEDHDFYPLEAAKKAAAAGITIFPIGFGSEEGSRISITDPETGATTVLRHQGEPVVSRLDGALLRDLAEVTGGRYIPAGTGVLDLESIYHEVLGPLTRGELDGRGRAVRHEGFQWALLAALVALVASVAVANGRRRHEPVLRLGLARTSAAVALAGLIAASPAVALAQIEVDDETFAELEEELERAAEETSGGGDTAEATAEPAADALPEDPLLLYNRGVEALGAGALERAATHLERARRDAGDDGRIRYRAAYNLGWVHVKEHDRRLENEPEEALRHLYTAADWFRDAVRQRADAIEARRNLEIVMRKALALEDALRAKDERDLAARLDELIARQRGLIGEARGLVERVTASAVSEEEIVERFRTAFRGLATTERKILSDAGRLAESAAHERAAIAEKPEEERTPEERMRAAQIGALLHYVHRARERLGQARKQLRQRRGERAYRRASAGLRELKRARDQLRDPVAVLGAIIADATELARWTARHAAARDGISVAGGPEIPPWSTLALLSETVTDLEERTTELHQRLAAAVDQANAETASEPADEAPALDDESRRVLAQVREALPFIATGRERFGAAGSALAEEDPARALDEEREAILSLLAARERFLDVRGLIELIHSSEAQVEGMIANASPEVREQLHELAPMLFETAERDLERSARLDALLAEELAEVAGTASTEPGEAADPEDAAARETERQRLELARELVRAARTTLGEARERFDGARELAPAPAGEAVAAAHPAVADTVEHLADLRRLFFSIVEHLKEAARQQAELNDDTVDVAALTEEDERAAAVGPLIPRQRELERRSAEIARALAEQASHMPSQPHPDENPSPEAEAASERLARASELVTAASQEMNGALGSLEEAPPALDVVTEEQATALEQLLAAIALLAPPDPQPQQAPEQQRQEEEQGDAGAEAAEERNEPDPSLDPAQLLQAVRDREAERREAEREARRRGYEPVDKDW